MLVAGAITTWIAFASADGLVAEDYYKQGLGINRLLAREDTGRRLGVSADLEIEQGAGKEVWTQPPPAGGRVMKATRLRNGNTAIITLLGVARFIEMDKDGKEVTVKVTKDTKVKAKPATKVEEIKAGTRVVVSVVEEKDKTLTAKAIEIGSVPAAK